MPFGSFRESWRRRALLTVSLSFLSPISESSSSYTQTQQDSVTNLIAWFRQAPNRTAAKMQDPSTKTIRLYDLRHYFATMTYHKTRDILFTKQQMGHRKIETTLIYTQLLQFDKDDNYTCKVAQTVEQATELIENGFEYVTEMDGIKLFRKGK